MKSVGILGAGVMGKEIAITCAAFNFDVVLCDSSAEVRDELPRRLRSLIRTVLSGTLPRCSGVSR